jgi:hypothetical protein
MLLRSASCDLSQLPMRSQIDPHLQTLRFIHVEQTNRRPPSRSDPDNFRTGPLEMCIPSIEARAKNRNDGASFRIYRNQSGVTLEKKTGFRLQSRHEMESGTQLGIIRILLQTKLALIRLFSQLVEPCLRFWICPLLCQPASSFRSETGCYGFQNPI